jgi:predicted nucleic acid-binding protein
LKICFDASFLSSLYAADANTQLAVAAMTQTPAVRMVTHLTELELRNSLQLRVFRKDLSAAEARSAYADWQTDLSDGLFVLHALPEAWLRRSHVISQTSTARLGVRSLDLIHVASALELAADALFSFDERQRRLARELKLKVN